MHTRGVFQPGTDVHAINILDLQVLVVDQPSTLAERSKAELGQLRPRCLCRHLDEAGLEEVEFVEEDLFDSSLRLIILHELFEFPMHEVVLM